MIDYQVVASYMRRIFFGVTGQGDRSGSGSGGGMNIRPASYLFIWGLPAVLAVLPLTTRNYGHTENDVFCWIAHDEEDAKSVAFSKLWQAVTVGIPATVGVGYNMWVYYRIMRGIHAWSVVSTSAGACTCNILSCVLVLWHVVSWSVVQYGTVLKCPIGCMGRCLSCLLIITALTQYCGVLTGVHRMCVYMSVSVSLRSLRVPAGATRRR